uniref:Tetraspanin n=1 Tax=Pristionchus pacificus TaxID=54126 RepID=A0A8R1V258_PRIPA
MVEGGVAIVKYLLFVANLILWVIGLALIICGSVLHLKFAKLLDILGDDRLSTPVLLLSLGALCTLLGFLGCCGAIRENYCLTVSFAVLLALLLMLETAAVIAGYALHETLLQSLTNQLTQGLSRYSSSTGVTKAWDETQKAFSCCGVTNSTDWKEDIPISCCEKMYSGCVEREKIFVSGCISKIEGWIVSNAALVGGVSTVMSSLQIVGVCFACCLSKSILKDFHDFYY